MDRYFFEIEKYLVGTNEIHYNILNLEEFKKYYFEIIKPKVKKYRKENSAPKYVERILVNNLKIISQQIIKTLNAKNVSVVKQVVDDEYSAGNGVRNIKALRFPYANLIDLNALVNKSAEVIDDISEFNGFCNFAERMISLNDDDIPNSLASMIRKDIKKVFEEDSEFKKIQWKCRVNGEELEHFRDYYHGGICFVNKAFEGKTVQNVFYADMTSAYISQMVNRVFPTKRPIKVITTIRSPEEVQKILENNFYLVCVKLNEAQLKNKNINPLKIKAGMNILWLTNLDYQILKDTVEIESFNIGELWVFEEMKPLPESVRNVMKNLFLEKQEMKAKKGTDEFDAELYEVKKRKVNISYGIFGSGIDVKFCNIFWAIFTTAWQRFSLWQTMKKNDPQNIIYGDTDSVYSKKKIEVPEGNDLGKWECEEYSRICVRGNKGYITENKRNKRIHLVLSGAAKQGVLNYIKENNITNDILFSDGYFSSLEIPAKYEVIYRYVANEDEVYKKCYDLKLKRAETISEILIDKYNLHELFY